jgi:hypothetical protein
MGELFRPKVENLNDKFIEGEFLILWNQGVKLTPLFHSNLKPKTKKIKNIREILFHPLSPLLSLVSYLFIYGLFVKQ